MAIKSFEIDIDGKKETIEYEDDLNFGEFEYILNQCADFSDVSKIRVDIPKYKQLVLLTVLRKAPFPLKDLDALNRTKTSVIRKIMKGVMVDYPLAKFLEESAEMIVGKDEDVPQTKSILSLPESMDGIKE